MPGCTRRDNEAILGKRAVRRKVRQTRSRVEVPHLHRVIIRGQDRPSVACQRLWSCIRLYNRAAKQVSRPRLITQRVPLKCLLFNPIEPRWVHANRGICRPDGDLPSIELRRRLCCHFDTELLANSFKICDSFYTLWLEHTQRMTDAVKIATQNNTPLIVNIALSYSGRLEILNAVRRVIKAIEQEQISHANLNEAQFAHYLDRGHLPFPDLYIRCGGVNRISNFMLWQSACTEIVSLDILGLIFAHSTCVRPLRLIRRIHASLGL